MTTLLLFLSLVFAQQAITASDAWIAELAADAVIAEAYLSINNPTMYDIYLVTVTSDVAGKIEFRDGGKPLKEITVPSYGSADLTAAGPHLVLMDLKKALKAGEHVTLTMMTDGGVTVVTTAVVKTR